MSERRLLDENGVVHRFATVADGNGGLLELEYVYDHRSASWRSPAPAFGDAAAYEARMLEQAIASTEDHSRELARMLEQIPVGLTAARERVADVERRLAATPVALEHYERRLALRLELARALHTVEVTELEPRSLKQQIAAARQQIAEQRRALAEAERRAREHR